MERRTRPGQPDTSQLAEGDFTISLLTSVTPRMRMGIGTQLDQRRLPAEGILGLLALGDVEIDLHDRHRPSCFIPLQGLPAEDHKLTAVFSRVRELPLPTPLRGKDHHVLLEGHGKPGLKECVSYLAE